MKQTYTEKVVNELAELALNAATVYDMPKGMEAILELKKLSELVQERTAEATDRMYLASLEKFGAFTPVEVAGIGRVSARVSKSYEGLPEDFYKSSSYSRNTVDTEKIKAYLDEHDGKLPEGATQKTKVSLIFPKGTSDEQD